MNIRLRKFNFRTDLSSMFAMVSDLSDQMLFVRKLTLNTIEDFEQWVSANFRGFYHEFNVITDQSGSDVLGFIYSYEYDHINLNCKISMIIKKEIRNKGIGAFALYRFLNDLFAFYPLHKVFVNVYDYNENSLQCLMDAGFTEEGCYKEFRYCQGKFYDLHILGMTREYFKSRYNGIGSSDVQL